MVRRSQDKSKPTYPKKFRCSWFPPSPKSYSTTVRLLSVRQLDAFQFAAPKETTGIDYRLGEALSLLGHSVRLCERQGKDRQMFIEA